MMFRFTLLFWLLVGHLGWAQNWQEANDLYANKKYNEAYNAYKALEKNFGHSADYWYNRGNAAYKNKLVADAIYSFEKALQIKPHFSDARYNLSLAEALKTDKFDPSASYAFNQKVRYILGGIPENILVYGSLFSLFIALVFLLIFRRMRRLKWAKSIGSVLLIFYVVLTVISVVRAQYLDSDKAAIVSLGRVSILAEPNSAATTLFVLHEGTKVLTHEERESKEWIEIELSDGRVGWCTKEALLVL